MRLFRNYHLLRSILGVVFALSLVGCTRPAQFFSKAVGLTAVEPSPAPIVIGQIKDPSVSRVIPSRVGVGKTTPLKIEGQYFEGREVEVSWISQDGQSTLACSSASVDSDSQITCTLSPHPAPANGTLTLKFKEDLKTGALATQGALSLPIYALDSPFLASCFRILNRPTRGTVNQPLTPIELQVVSIYDEASPGFALNLAVGTAGGTVNGSATAIAQTDVNGKVNPSWVAPAVPSVAELVLASTPGFILNNETQLANCVTIPTVVSVPVGEMPPTLSQIQPGAVSSTATTLVRLLGTFLINPASVEIKAVNNTVYNCTGIQAISPTEVRCTMPSGMPVGATTVTFIRQDGEKASIAHQVVAPNDPALADNIVLLSMAPSMNSLVGTQYPVNAEIRDINGNPIAGVPVKGTATGMGTVDGLGVSTKPGPAAFDWLLGLTPGTNVLTLAGSNALPNYRALFGIDPMSKSEVVLTTATGYPQPVILAVLPGAGPNQQAFPIKIYLRDPIAVPPAQLTVRAGTENIPCGNLSLTGANKEVVCTLDPTAVPSFPAGKKMVYLISPKDGMGGTWTSTYNGIDLLAPTNPLLADHLRKDTNLPPVSTVNAVHVVSFKVASITGAAVPGFSVRLTAMGNGASLSATQVTSDAMGVVTAQFTVGSTPGTYSVKAEPYNPGTLLNNLQFIDPSNGDLINRYTEILTSTVADFPAPQLTQILPPNIPIGASQLSVRITGSGFIAGSTFSISLNSATNPGNPLSCVVDPMSVAPTQLMCILSVPMSYQPGLFDLMLTQTSPSGTVQSATLANAGSFWMSGNPALADYLQLISGPAPSLEEQTATTSVFALRDVVGMPVIGASVGFRVGSGPIQTAVTDGSGYFSAPMTIQLGANTLTAFGYPMSLPNYHGVTNSTQGAQIAINVTGTPRAPILSSVSPTYLIINDPSQTQSITVMGSRIYGMLSTYYDVKIGTQMCTNVVVPNPNSNANTQFTCEVDTLQFLNGATYSILLQPTVNGYPPAQLTNALTFYDRNNPNIVNTLANHMQRVLDLPGGTVAGNVYPISVKVMDRNGNGLQNIQVTFQVTQGNGTVMTSPVTTDAAGIAQTNYTTGSGMQTVRAYRASSPLPNNPNLGSVEILFNTTSILIPQITQVTNPARVGRTFTVDGSNFNPSTTVAFGGVPCVPVVVNQTGTQLTCTTPSIRIGNYAVVVSNGQGADNTVMVDVVPGSPQVLAFTRQPNSVVAGNPVVVEVTALDSAGNIVTNGSGVVALEWSSNPGGNPPLGLSLNIGSGVVTFTVPGTHTQRSGVGYQLSATAGGASSASNPFNISAGTPATLTPVGTLGSVEAGGVIGPVMADLKDQYGNPISGAMIQIGLPNGASVTVPNVNATQLPTDANGRISFNVLTGPVAGNYSIQLSYNSLTATIPYTTVPSMNGLQLVLSGVPGSGTIGTPFAFNVAVQNGQNQPYNWSNPVTAYAYPASDMACPPSQQRTMVGSYTPSNVASFPMNGMVMNGNAGSYKIYAETTSGQGSVFGCSAGTVTFDPSTPLTLGFKDIGSQILIRPEQTTFKVNLTAAASITISSSGSLPGTDFTLKYPGSNLLSFVNNQVTVSLPAGDSLFTLNTLSSGQLKGLQLLQLAFTSNSPITYTSGSSLNFEINDNQSIDLGLDGQTRIAAGAEHTCATVTVNGTQSLACWGDNRFGQLGAGTGSLMESVAPVLMRVRDGQGNLSPLTEVQDFALGAYSTLVVVGAERKLYMAGYDTPVGDHFESSMVAVPVMGANESPVTQVSKVTAGQNHVCYISDVNQQAYCFGRNQFGQLGDNSTLDRLVPVATGFTASEIAASSFATCATQTGGGAVYCWGDNSQGQVAGGPGGANRLVPTIFPQTRVTANLRGATELKGMGYARQFCIRLTNGALSCWGQNDVGQLANGNGNYYVYNGGNQNFDANTPYAFRGGSYAIGSKVFCAIDTLNTNARLVCAGVGGPENRRGLANDFNVGTSMNYLYQVSGAVYYSLETSTGGRLTKITQAALGATHGCAITSNAGVYRLYCWGGNNRGQAGIDTWTTVKTATRVQAIATLPRRSFVDVGDRHSCVNTKQGKVYCWGENADGKLGFGSLVANSYATPQQVKTGAESTLSNVIKIDAGRYSTCAIVAPNREVWCWGKNAKQNISQNRFASSGYASPIVMDAEGTRLNNVLDLSVGDDKACVIVANSNQLKCFGFSLSGLYPRDFDLGGMTTNQLLGLSLNTSGGIYQRGDKWNIYIDYAGQTTKEQKTIFGVSKVVAGATHYCFQNLVGVSQCYGTDASGELGNAGGGASYYDGTLSTIDVINNGGNAATATVNFQTLYAAWFSDLSAGANFTCGVTDFSQSGTPKGMCFGKNTSYELGFAPADNSVSSMSYAYQVAGGVGYYQVNRGAVSAIQITAGQNHGCAVTRANEVYCWGSNDYNRCGSTSAGNLSPTVVVVP